ncbi:synaptopodin-2 isoform X1 [Nerophis lumbriciformis]|uniref:synaptopodin-2 isoform X1 n=1 Tax=Nerophis lumbriciformis TaxID=546530 RepID=UPI003BACC0EB
MTESTHIKASPTSFSSKPECHDTQSHCGQKPKPCSISSSSSLGFDPKMTRALTLTTDEPPGAINRPSPGTGNRRFESSEEGGSSEAPPAAVFFGISDEGAEQPQKWNLESEADLCRPDSHGTRCTRFGQDESQSQRQVKETKSKCKRIARLLTDAPNPQNKGALLFKKRRQRVEKYTLVSYGTGDRKFDGENHLPGEEAEEVSTAGYNFVAASDSEFEEEYSAYRRQQDLSLNWESVKEMEVLPATKGKGVMMFARRSKRMDEIVSRQELRSKELHLDAMSEPAKANSTYDTREMYDHSDRNNYMDRHIQQMNQQRSLVANRTAKPFLGFQIRPADHTNPSGVFPGREKSEPKFKIPVPIISSPQVWSPTGDIIASRDERISVPAIKTCNLPELRRKQTLKQRSNPRYQNKGQSKAYVESEEDCFSLGAEACNFMQPRPVKLKNPPPVAPKPAINPKCPPWRRGPPSEPCIPTINAGSQSSNCPVRHQGQHRHFEQDWAQPQKSANCWEANQAPTTIQTPATGQTLVSSSSQPRLQATTNSWGKQLPRPSVSMQSYSPHHTQSRSTQDSAPSSVASCPPKPVKSFAPKISLAPLRDQVSGRSYDRSGAAQTMTEKGLLSKRQSRTEKVSGGQTTNQTRSSSPTMSLPNSWRYSSNIRAPPPLSYNPLHTPFYTPPAVKKFPSSSKEKPKSSPKHLNTLEIMKHQPHHLDSSLFRYDAAIELKIPSAKPSLPSKFDITQKLKQRSTHSHSPNISELDFESKSEASAKSSAKSFGAVSSPNSSAWQHARSAEPLALYEHLDEKHAGYPTSTEQAPSSHPSSASFRQSASIALAFSPASIIARGARQMAPRPKFSAKKSVVTTKQWRPVAMLN